MSDTEELEPFEAKVVAAGHVLVREADGSVDIFVMDFGPHNGPGCSVCDDCWCRHCDGPVEPCDGGAAKLEAEAKARVALAAPDLLAAAQTALAYCEHLKSSSFAVEPTHAAELRAAIAKATGA